MIPSRDPGLAGRVLLAERDALLPLLERTEPAGFDRPTVCTGWSVRDVLAHCGSVLGRAANGRLGDFSPTQNEVDVSARRGWPLDQVIAELSAGYEPAAEAITAAAGRLDGVALGEWVHGGDVRDALGEPWAYGSEGAEDAVVLLAERSRAASARLLRARVSGRDLTLGVAADGRPAATLTTDLPTLVRLYAGRRPDPSRYRLDGANPDELVLFS
ncbi:MAG TPA: maleylpyruvate isomerase family mycothiol-dependent enzyme [Mycobacteriales bacterium]|nr:maleylpyruvate isomerase family mycothiol-dependent enzyme [Mycobacteriales bacterium]